MLDISTLKGFVKENQELTMELYNQGFLSTGEIRLIEEAMPGIFRGPGH